MLRLGKTLINLVGHNTMQCVKCCYRGICKFLLEEGILGMERAISALLNWEKQLSQWCRKNSCAEEIFRQRIQRVCCTMTMNALPV